MKLIDALKEKGNPFWIPDCTRSELPEFFVQLGFKRGAEIGVSHGLNMVDYLEAGLEMYGIDPWMDSEDNIHRKVISVEGKYGRTAEGIYELAKIRLAKYPNCTLIRKDSVEASKDFPKRSLDFVYIDGNHLFGYVAMDLMKWSRKVRRGGIIAGHDYWFPKDWRAGRTYRDVRYVVDAYVKHCDVDNWYILGSKEPQKGERFDAAYSFFFIKHW